MGLSLGLARAWARCELGGHFFLAFRHDCPTRHLRLSALADSLSDDDDDGGRL